MEKQLEKYGLTLDDAKILRWEKVVIDEKGLPPVKAIKIPYYHPLNLSKEVTAANGSAFVRYRVLPHELATSDSVQEFRYIQPKGTGVEAYFPPSIPWDQVSKDESIQVIITEGEAKAAKACKEGFATVGLGGVNSFRSLKKGILLCSTLESFNWKGRTVYIIFDSDIVQKIQVVHAMNALACAMGDCGADTYVCFLPESGDKKVGLDDYLIANGADALDRMLATASPIGSVKSLMELNTRYYVIKSNASIYSLEQKKLISKNNFTSVVEAAKKAVAYKVAQGGKIQPELVSAADAWLQWPMRAELKGIVYEPGQPEVLNNCLNIWSGWGCTPRQGTAELFVQLVDYMFSNNLDDKNWFLQWLAYPIQYPGTKLFTAAVLYSQSHGTGKSFLGQIMGRIYGSNFSEIRSSDLQKDFNHWAENKQFILGDEITSSDKRKESDELKRMITRNELRINKKYLEEYVIRDCINYLFTTNHPDAFFLEDKDRRYFIHEILADPLDDSFYARLHHWVYSENGAEEVFHYLLNYDTKSFNPRARARETIGKARMFMHGLGDMASWIRCLLNDPDGTLVSNDKSISKDVFTAKELLRIYDPSNQSRVTPGGLARELAKAGVNPLLGGKRVRTRTGTDVVFAIRNIGYWMQITSVSDIQKAVLENADLIGRF